MLEFTPLTFKQAQRYTKLYEKSRNKSFDCTFTSMWTNKDTYQYELAFDKDLCWVRYHEQDKVYYRLPVGNLDNCDWKHIIRDCFPANAEIKSVLAPLALEIHLACRDMVRLREEPKSTEYLYDVDKQINLPGMRYHIKKMQAKFFLHNYDYAYQPLTMANVERVIDFHKKLFQYKKVEPFVEEQNKTILKILKNWHLFKTLIKGNVLKLDGEIIGYAVGEAVDKDNVFMYFSNASSNWKGAIQANDLLFLEQYYNCKYLNTGADKGIPGLRRLKQEYSPEITLMKKYHIRKQD